MMYRFFWLIGLMVIPAFIRRLFYVGRERFPNKPVFLALNHPNSFLDGVIVNAYAPRPLSSLVRGDVFRNPVARWWLRQFKLEPIFRAQDVEVAGENIKKNEETLEACERILEKNGAINIFVEGLSVQEKRLRPLRKGLARMALQAESQANWERDIHILPVGVNYTRFNTYQMEVMVEYGEPFAVRPLKEIYLENPNKAVKLLQNQIDQGLKPLVVHIADPAMEKATEPLLELVRQRMMLPLLPWKITAPDRLRAEKQLTDWANTIAKDQPENWQKLAAESLDWQQTLDKNGVDCRAVTRKGNGWVRDLLLVVLLAVPALAGAIVHAIPYITIKYFCNKIFKNTVFYDSVYIGGALAFQGIWTLLWSLVALQFNGWVALAMWVVLPALLQSRRIWEQAWIRLLPAMRFIRLSKEIQNSLIQKQLALISQLPV